MRPSYSKMFGTAMTALLILLLLSFPYKGESMLTRLVRSAKVLQ